MLRAFSILGLLFMIAGILALMGLHALFSMHPAVLATQAAAVALMAWARVTFGRRSFHAAADPTAGGIVTTGPYRYIRHPIYTSVCLFVVAGTLAHLSAASAALCLLVVAGALVRMVAEERLVTARYPEYAAYAAVTKRMLPRVF